jgi:hypothetical protein
MTKEEKQLLLKDLCARLYYGVYVDAYSWQKDTPKLLLECVPEYIGEEIVVNRLAGRHSIKEIKPYLRPMSSMTEEEREEYCNLQDRFLCSPQYPVTDAYEIFDWLNSHHFDYRGLIPMGLALEAPEDMYKEG